MAKALKSKKVTILGAGTYDIKPSSNDHCFIIHDIAVKHGAGAAQFVSLEINDGTDQVTKQTLSADGFMTLYHPLVSAYDVYYTIKNNSASVTAEVLISYELQNNNKNARL